MQHARSGPAGASSADRPAAGARAAGEGFYGHQPGYPVIDALDVHAALLADLATGAKTLADVARG